MNKYFLNAICFILSLLIFANPVLANHDDNIAVVTDSNGDKYELTDYYPYGSTRLDEKVGSFENTHKFTGKELDSETGLYYYGQRYYDPNIGRWVSEDPMFLFIAVKPDFKTEYVFEDIRSKNKDNKKSQDKYLSNPQNLNVYSYTANNPLKYVDPNGEFYQYAIAPIVGFSGGIVNQYAADIVENIQNGASGINIFKVHF